MTVCLCLLHLHSFYHICYLFQLIAVLTERINLAGCCHNGMIFVISFSNRS